MAIGAVGAAALGTSTFLFLAPERDIPSWPWLLTPLTARVMGAIFALGIGGLFVAADRRWSAARTMLEVQGLMLVLTTAAGIRSHDDLDFSRPLARTLVAGLGATLLGGALLYLLMHRRERSHHLGLRGAGS